MSVASRPAEAWQAGTLVWFRGVEVPLDVRPDGGGLAVLFAGQQVRARTQDPAGIRPAVEAHLWRLARQELPARLSTVALRLGARPSAVTVRNQRSRWGSCAPTGRISLNWRLIQMPAEAADYILVHELTHLSVPDHSRRFWRAVERACPGYRDARAWIRTHQRAIEGR